MKKTFFVISIFAVCLFASCDDDKDEIVGSENITQEDRIVSDFQSIDVESIIDLDISFGTSQKVQVTANENIHERIETEVSNNTLFISLKDGPYSNISIKMDITIPDLSKVHNEGTGNIIIQDFIDLDEITIESIGTGNISAEGTADKLIIDLTGTGNFNGFEFLTKSTSAKLTGTGNIEVFCSESLDGSLTGIGNLFYKGNPNINVTVTGTGNLVDAN